MKTNSFTPMGSLHPVLFFVFIYVVTLIVSIFICSSLFYSCNASPAQKPATENSIQKKTDNAGASVAIR